MREQLDRPPNQIDSTIDRSMFGRSVVLVLEGRSSSHRVLAMPPVHVMPKVVPDTLACPDFLPIWTICIFEKRNVLFWIFCEIHAWSAVIACARAAGLIRKIIRVATVQERILGIADPRLNFWVRRNRIGNRC